MATPQDKPPDHIKKKMERALMNVYADVDRLIIEVWNTAYNNGFNNGWDRGYRDCQADIDDKPRAEHQV